MNKILMSDPYMVSGMCVLCERGHNISFHIYDILERVKLIYGFRSQDGDFPLWDDEWEWSPESLRLGMFCFSIQRLVT